MNLVQDWLEAYGESHQNPVNKKIHWICVPLIMLSLLALIGKIPFPVNSFKLFSIGTQSIYLSWTTLFLVYSVIFYMRLSFKIAIGMLIIAWSMIYIITLIEIYDPSVWKSSLIIFVFAWIGQFIGHKIEGKKPSFFQDIQFLLIGPAWLLSFIYNKFGIKF